MHKVSLQKHHCDSYYRLFDLRAGDCVHILYDHERFDPIVNFQFSNSGRLIFAAAKSKELKVWDTLNPTGALFEIFPLDIESNLASVGLTMEGGDLGLVSRNGRISVLSKNIDDFSVSEIVTDTDTNRA